MLSHAARADMRQRREKLVASGSSNAGVTRLPRAYQMSMTRSTSMTTTPESASAKARPARVWRRSSPATLPGRSRAKKSRPIDWPERKAKLSRVDMTVANRATKKRPRATGGSTSMASSGYARAGCCSSGNSARAYRPAVVVMKSKRIQNRIETRIPLRAIFSVRAA